MKRSLRRISTILGTALLLVFGLAALCLIRPGVVLNTAVARVVATGLGRVGISVTWQNATIEVRSQRLFQHLISFNFQGLCVHASFIDSCFTSVIGEVAADLTPTHPRLVKIGPVTASGTLMLTLANNQKDSSSGLQLPRWLSSTEVAPIAVTLTKFSAQVTAQSAAGAGQISITAPTPATLQIGVTGKDIILKTQVAEVALKDLQSAVLFSRTERSFALKKIGPTTLHASEVSVNLDGGRDASPSSAPAALPDWEVELAPTEVVVDRLEVKRGGHVFVGKAALFGKDSADGQSWRLAAEVANPTPNAPFSHARGEIKLTSFGKTFAGPWTGELKARAALAHGGTAAVNVTSKRIGTFAGDVTYQHKKQKFILNGAAQTKLDGVQIALSGDGENLVADLKKVHVHDCDLAIDRQKTAMLHASFGCQATLTAPTALPLPATVAFAAKGKLATPWPPTAALAGDAEVHLVPVKLPELTAEANATVQVNGWPPRVMAVADGKASVPKFALLVKKLAATRYAVPAPFNTLGGPVEFSGRAEHGPAADGWVAAHFNLKTQLSAKVARLISATEGTFNLPDNGRPKLTADVELSDAVLPLPTLSLKGKVPQLVPDKRIGKDEPPTAPAFDYTVQVRTPEAQPLRIITNLAKAPVPIRLNVKAAPAGATGDVKIGEVPLDLFRRSARVEYFNIDLKGSTSPRLAGKLRVDYTDYVIRIQVLGTLEAPVLKFASEPARSERELVAILLFGRDMSELDSDQMKSAESTRAAAADGVLGLASLYVLASTPIESIGYDPEAKALTAKIAVGQGTSLNVGADLEDYGKVGVRRRMGHSWAIDTFVERRADRDERSATALLEWSKRY